MSYHIDCECGRTITVRASDAGAEKKCLCGRTNRVPKLSELRQIAGEAAFTVGAVDRIRALQQIGKIPFGECMLCGNPTKAAVECEIVCEAPWVKKRSILFWIFACMTLGFVVAAFVKRKEESDEEVHGKDTVIRIPISLCPTCESTHPMGLHVLVYNLLRSNSTYRHLFEEYPNLQIAVVGRL